LIIVNLDIFYLSNKTGNELANLLKNQWETVNCYETSFQDSTYLKIQISDINSDWRRVINSRRAVENCLDKNTFLEIMQINNIPCGDLDEEKIIRIYEVLICDLSSISIKSTKLGKTDNKAVYIKESENAKLVEVAKRTVYLLGLDIGMVKIVLTAKRKLKVVGVDPSPVIRSKDLENIIEMIEVMYFTEENLKEEQIKLGADPEFMIFNSKSGKMISASEFFPREGTVGCDNIRVPNRQQRPVAEIRPQPHSCPLELMANIKKALDSANRIAPYRNVKWLAGSQPVKGYSIGGHIHFSNIKFNACILRALDNYIGIPIFLIENPATATKRRQKYGFLGDYRFKEYGGFEYRTPGSWLVSQEIAAAVLCLAKIVASRYPQLSSNYLINVEAQRAFYQGDQNYFKPIFLNHLWVNLKKIDMYDKYKEELEIIPKMIAAGIYWDENTDIRKAWKMASVTRKIYKESNKKAPTTTGTASGVQFRNTLSSTPRNNGRGNNRRNSANRVISPGQIRRAYAIH